MRYSPPLKHLSGVQGLHSVAYTGALGRPLICPDGGTANLSADTLHEFVSSNFVAPKMVLAVAGTEHRALLELAEPMLNTVAGGSPPSQPASEYAGGDFRQLPMSIIPSSSPCVGAHICVWIGICIHTCNSVLIVLYLCHQTRIDQ